MVTQGVLESWLLFQSFPVMQVYCQRVDEAQREVGLFLLR